jgi:hypothetical protein
MGSFGSFSFFIRGRLRTTCDTPCEAVGRSPQIPIPSPPTALVESTDLSRKKDFSAGQHGGCDDQAFHSTLG